MSNGNLKTKMVRIPEEWMKIIEETIKKIEENGYPERIMPPEIIRLLIHYRPSRTYLNKAFESIIGGFQGVQKINPEVEKWMKGKGSSGIPMEAIQ